MAHEERGSDSQVQTRAAVETVMPSTSVFDAVKLMAEKNIGDLVKDIIFEQKFIIEQLEQYISGGMG